MKTHRNLIITAEYRDTAKLLCETLAPIEGVDMFQSELAPVDSEEVTHYMSAGDISAQFAAILPCQHSDGTTSHGSPETIAYLAAQAGLNITLEQISEMLTHATITDHGDWREAIAPLNLRLV